MALPVPWVWHKERRQIRQDQYYVLCNLANCHAGDWWNGNYVRILYPDANLSRQRISDMLLSIGDEGVYRDFFKEYVKLLARREEVTDILIAGTGLPDSIHFPLTAIRTSATR